METQFKLLDLILNIVEQNNTLIAQNKTLSSQNLTISKKLENIEDKIKPTKIVKDDFNITTFKQASKIVKCSLSVFRDAVKSNTLKQNIHYKTNGKRRYLFSNSALEDIKGTL